MKTKTPAALAANALKAEIKKAFPSIAVSVKSENYSMGCSVNVYVTDQPPATMKTIHELAAKYQYGHFDSMNDIYESTNRRDDIPQAKYVFVNNDKSDDMRARLKEYAFNKWLPGDVAVTGYGLDQTIHRLFSGATPGFWHV
jgi:hypothetical protein